MRAIIAACIWMVSVAQGQEIQLTSAPVAASQPTSAPASPAEVLVSQPASEAAQCTDCLTPPAMNHKAAKILGVSGVAGLYVSFKGMGAFEQLENPMMKASVGLGVASLTSLNASVAALGISRYKKTGKLRPLFLSTLFSGGLVVGHFTMAMAAAWSQDSAIEPEPGQETDIADAVVGTFLASSGTAFLISSGMLLKTSKEVASWYWQRREERVLQESKQASR